MYPSYPFQQPYGQAFQQPPRKTEIIHVNGENGAMAFQMMPNSQALLLDDTAPLVWLAQTDGAGYKTLTPYTITPYEQAKPVDINALNERLTRVEAMLNESDIAKTSRDEPQSE